MVTGVAKERRNADNADCSAASGTQASMINRLPRRYLAGNMPSSPNTSLPSPMTVTSKTSCIEAASAAMAATLPSTTSDVGTGRLMRAFQLLFLCSTRQTRDARIATATGRMAIP